MWYFRSSWRCEKDFRHPPELTQCSIAVFMSDRLHCGWHSNSRLTACSATSFGHGMMQSRSLQILAYCFTLLRVILRNLRHAVPQILACCCAVCSTMLCTIRYILLHTLPHNAVHSSAHAAVHPSACSCAVFRTLLFTFLYILLHTLPHTALHFSVCTPSPSPGSDFILFPMLFHSFWLAAVQSSAQCCAQFVTYCFTGFGTPLCRCC